MKTLPRPPLLDPARSLALLLLGTLCLSGVLVYQAREAVRSHRAASEGALRDYAAFASWELGRRLEGDLQRLLNGALLRSRLVTRPAQARWSVGFLPGGDPGHPPPLSETVEGMTRECDCPGAIHDLFSLDLRSGSLSLAEARVLGSRREWLAARMNARAHAPATALPTLPTLPMTFHVRERRDLVVARSPAREARQVVRLSAPLEVLPLPGVAGSAVVFSLVRDDEGNPLEAYGYVVDLPAVTAAAARRVIAGAPLLPPSLTRGAGNQEILSISVASPGGRPVLRVGSAGASVAFSDTVATLLGPLATRVAVRPEVAGRLVIGGLPRSRLPLILVVFALTLGLAGVAVVQLRRQQELVRLRGDFVAGVSHELRTPLAQIRLFAELLASGRLHERQRQRSVRIINEESQRLAYLVENVLRFSRSEQRQTRLATAPVEVGELLREIVDAFAPLARAREVTVALEADEGITASLDRDAVRQVLLNLLDNAVKYGPVGQEVRASLAREGTRLRIAVDDRGPGVPAADRERIWRPYLRLEREVEASTGGSGIGLAVVRELVELHGGSVGVEDAPGGGARFLVWLPAGERPAPAVPNPSEREATRA